MSKKLKSLFCFVLVVTFLLPTNIAMAAENESSKSTKTIEYLADGSYYETEIIEYANARSTITGASKTTTYKNENGKALWYVKVTANFYFDGSTSRCTSASASAGSYTTTWRIDEKYASKSGNSATATAVASCYVGPSWVGSVKKSVTLTCDKNGNLS